MICHSKLTCSVCSSSYFLKSESQCEPCLSGCEHCTSSLTCRKCISGFTHIKTQDAHKCVGSGMSLMAWILAAIVTVSFFLMFRWWRIKHIEMVNDSQQMIEDLAAAANN